MLSWLFKSKQVVLKEQPVKEETIVPDGFTIPPMSTQLLDTPRCQKLLSHIWQRTSISRQQFNLLYLKPIERYADLVQQFPASEAHHLHTREECLITDWKLSPML